MDPLLNVFTSEKITELDFKAFADHEAYLSKVFPRYFRKKLVKVPTLELL